MDGEQIQIVLARDAEREWCAQVMAGTEPWITLGRRIEHCRAACNDGEYLLFVAHADADPCGFIRLQRRGVAGSPYIVSVAVAEEFRGKGVGTRLLDFAEKLFASEFRHIFLCVSSFNLRARALYERHGYEIVGEFKDYVIPGASEILMHKRL